MIFITRKKAKGFTLIEVLVAVAILGFAIPSIMMARNIPNSKERLITMMVTPLMSCSARIPVYVLLIAMFVPATKVMGIFNLSARLLQRTAIIPIAKV